MTDRIISIYGALEDVPNDFTGIAKVENANYEILIKAKNINGVITRKSDGSSDLLTNRPNSALLGKGTWQVGDITYVTDGSAWTTSESLVYTDIPGKNIINPTTILNDKYISSNSGVISTASPGYRTTDFISWGDNYELRFITNTNIATGVAYALQFDNSYAPIASSYYNGGYRAVIKKANNAAYIKVTTGPAITGEYMGFFSINTDDRGFMVEPSFEPYSIKKSVSINKNAESIVFAAATTAETTYITKTFNRTGTAGITADFVGLNAIGDALASITDASPSKRYRLLGSGEFLFSSISDFVYTESTWGIEKTVVVGKDYVDIIGISVDKLIIAVELPDNLAINYGDYQPILWNCNSLLANATIIAKNCRYAIHYDFPTRSYRNSISRFKNLKIWHKGNYNWAYTSQSGSTGWTATNAVGSGINDGQELIFENCELRSDQALAFACHSGTAENFTKSPIIKFTHCELNTRPQYNTFVNNSIVYIILDDVILPHNAYVSVGITGSTRSINADTNETIIYSNSLPLPYSCSGKGKGLRIKSKTTGILSIVTVDTACTAFSSIIGFIDNTVLNELPWKSNYQYGYEWKNGKIGTSGYICGHIDIDSTTTHTSLGKKLGNCSITNKTLSLTIDGTAYNIIFNTDLTAATNAAVITLITNVIGAVATVDEFFIAGEHYPNFRGNKSLINADTIALNVGMGIVFTDATHCRAALNSDGYIDGIIIDMVGVGDVGRIITGAGASIYSANSNARFSTIEATNVSRTTGTALGISTTLPGVFDVTTTPKVLRAIDTNILKIL